MGFFSSKTPEERFKDKIARQDYYDAIAIVYGKGLKREFVSDVVLTEYKRAEDHLEERNLRTLREVFGAYLKTPEERFKAKIGKRYFHELLELASFEHLSEKFVEDELSSTRQQLLKEGDLEEAEKVQDILEAFLQIKEKQG